MRCSQVCNAAVRKTQKLISSSNKQIKSADATGGGAKKKKKKKVFWSS